MFVQVIRSKKMIVSVGLVFVAVALSFYYGRTQPLELTSNTISTNQKTPLTDNNTVFIPQYNLGALPRAEESANQATGFDSIVKDLIQKLKNEHAETIQNIVVQVSLKEFLDDLIRIYPKRGRELFERVIKGAFPELADKILSAVSTMEIYDKWLLEYVLTFNDMNLLQQKGTLWNKRTALFGEDAKKIWSEEITAEEDRRIALKKTVSLLDQAFDTPANERIYILQSAFQAEYGDTMENAILDTKGVLSQVFFGFNSVQEELSQLSNEDRQIEINNSRRVMGFDEITIAELAQRDQVREERWQNGYGYSDERKQLQESLSGEELKQSVHELQVKYFKNEAPTIAREEQDELFRFERERVYGRN